jgi:hypothetical protein
MSALTAGGATWSRRVKTPLMACIVGRSSEAGVVDGPELGTSSRMGVIWARVVRNSCQIPQNAVAEASLDGEEPVEAGPPFGAVLPQAVRISPSAAAIDEVASNGRRRALRVVFSMPL